MKTQFTPGPWQVCEKYTDRHVYPIGHPVGADYKHISILAEVNSCGGTPDQCKANARLIAAAPQLLAALQRLAMQTEGTIALHKQEGKTILQGDLVPLRQARAAITAATQE